MTSEIEYREQDVRRREANRAAEAWAAVQAYATEWAEEHERENDAE